MNKWDLALESRGGEGRAASSRIRSENRTSRKRVLAKHTSVVRKKAVTGRVNPAQLMEDYEKIVRTRFKFLDYAPIIFVSALTGEHTDKLFALVNRIADARRRRISTGELNRWLSEVDLDRGTSPAARKVKIYYVTQAATSAADVHPVHQPIQCGFISAMSVFIENQLRKSFDFIGAPIRFPAATEWKGANGSDSVRNQRLPAQKTSGPLQKKFLGP